MTIMDLSLFQRLTESGARLPWIKKWLINEKWSQKNYESLNHSQYLLHGEDAIN